MSAEMITKIYIGYFDRAPDPVGLDYWVGRFNDGMSLQEIAQSFSEQPESTNKYPYLATPNIASPDTFLSTVYANLFERTPDAEGLAYWKGQITSGRPIGEIIFDIINGATNTDAGQDLAILGNKTTVAYDWALSAADVAGLNYEENTSAQQAAADALDGSAADWASSGYVTTKEASTDEYFDSSNPVPGNTFVLTTGADSADASFFNAPVNVAPSTGTNVQTLSSVDTLTGTGDADVLTAVLNGTEAAGTAPMMTGIETVNLQSINAAGSIFSGMNATGITTLGVSGVVNSDLLIRDLAALTEINITGTDEDADLTVQFNNSVVSGTEDAVTLNLMGVGNGTPVSAVYTNDINIRGNTAGGIETLNISSTGSASRINSLGSDASVVAAAITDDSVVTKVNLTGDQDLTIQSELYGVTTFDASAFKGKLAVTFTDDTGDAKDVTVTGGEGDDTIGFLTGLTSKDTVDGGAGDNDTLAITGANGTTLGTVDGAIKVSNVEALAIAGSTAGNSTLDFDVFSAPAELKSVEVTGSDTSNRNVTLTDVQASSYTLKVEDDGAGGANDLGTVTIDLKDTTGLADKIAVNLVNDDQSAQFLVTEVDAQGIELMTLDASKKDADAFDQITVATLDADQLTALTITGDSDLTITNALDNLVKNVDASASTGDITLTAGVAEFKAAGGAGKDIFTSAGASFSDGVAGTSFAGGADADTFKYIDADASLTGANLTTAAASTNGGVNEILTITDMDFGSDSASGTVDKIDLSALTVLGADADSSITIVNGGAVEALSGANLGAAVNTLVNAGTLLDGTGTIAIGGLFSFGSNTYFIATSGATVNDDFGAVANSDIIINVTGYSGSLDASDIVV